MKKTHSQYTYFILSLLVALLVAGVFSTSIYAQEQEAELQPTQIIADIPEEYNEVFLLQWGGGSLYQLKQRLATMGCMADTLFTYNNNQWNSYNQYQVPSTLNAQFLTEYSQLIPAGTLYASCYDICDFNYYKAPKNFLPRCSTIETGQEKSYYGIFQYPIDNTTPCTRNFDPRVQASVLPIMPLYPDMCIVRQQTEEVQAGGIGGVSNPLIALSNAPYPYNPAFIVLFSPVVENESPAVLLGVEVHELCHTNQYWHFVENLQPDVIRDVEVLSTEQWSITPAGKSFIDLVGFTQNTENKWVLPDNTPYKNIYGIDDPVELSAELCMLYFMDKMGEPDIYSINQNNLDISQYLNPEVIQWLETYVVLPVIS